MPELWPKGAKAHFDLQPPDNGRSLRQISKRGEARTLYRVSKRRPILPSHVKSAGMLPAIGCESSLGKAINRGKVEVFFRCEPGSPPGLGRIVCRSLHFGKQRRGKDLEQGDGQSAGKMVVVSIRALHVGSDYTVVTLAYVEDEGCGAIGRAR